MSRETKNIFSLIIVICLIGLSILIFSSRIKENKRETSIEIEPIENTKLSLLKKTLESSTYFNNSNIVTNEANNSLIIDEKYEILIKTSYYQMTIKDQTLEDKYCEIVDAIEQGHGIIPGKSLETCKKTLEGSINIGGINAEIYDEYKVLSVNIDTPASLYNIDASHEDGDLIPVEEVSYNIQMDKYLLTSMKPSFQENTKLYSVCGNIFNPSKKASNEFKITIFDKEKKELASKNYKYENNTKKYIPFCINYPLETDTVKYYSITKIKEKK